ncbi:MAG: FG-GAP-like repeat-containing protein, partial [Bacteroidota bacterium]
AAFADLDNDGDLDLVVNNVNDQAFITENLSNNKSYLRIKLDGPTNNKMGLGSKIYVYTNNGKQFQEFNNSRGYLSSSEPILHFGIAKGDKVEKVEVVWPDKKMTTTNLSAGKLATIKYSENNSVYNDPTNQAKLFHNFAGNLGLNFKHIENLSDDYEKQVLLPHEMSKLGPRVSVGDINGDQYTDVFVSGAAGQPGVLFYQSGDMKFTPAPSQPWRADAACEDLESLFFDADQDGDQDLYVVSGGYEFDENSSLFQDRLYINNGNGAFIKSMDALPNITSSGGTVTAGDYDKDGDLDLFVGGRVIPDKYPYAPKSYILENNGGKFTDVTSKVGKLIEEVGMVSTSKFIDINNDGNLELVIAGEWMPLKIYSFENGSFKDISDAMGLSETSGWWNTIAFNDIDKDGDIDIVGGNLGLNYKYKASESEPFNIYCDDFDKNGTYDIVLGYYNAGKEFPLRGLQCSSEQMPFVKKKFPTYKQFASSTIDQVYGDKLEDALNYKVKTFASTVFLNNGSGFDAKPLPKLAQVSPIFGLLVRDFNGDSNPDILLAGNLYVAEAETGMADASNGLLLIGDGKGNFEAMQQKESGFLAPFDARDLDAVYSPSHKGAAIVCNNSNNLQVFAFNVNGSPVK